MTAAQYGLRRSSIHWARVWLGVFTADTAVRARESVRGWHGCVSRVLRAGGVLTPSMVLCVLAVALMAGCDRQPTTSGPVAARHNTAPARPPLQLHDWVRQPIVHESEGDDSPLRIISAAPNVTEICCALGLRLALVGRTRYCDYPPGIEQVPSIGALNDVNVEALLELRPDLILVSGTSRAQLERFALLDLRIESIPDANLTDLFAGIRLVGTWTGRARTAERLCAGIEADLAAVSAQFAGATPARVLLLTGTLSDPPRPPFVAGPGSFYDDLLTRAGHENVVAGKQAAFGPLSLEFIVRADPDVIIELDPDGRQRPGGDADARRVWAEVGALHAVSTRRVHVLTGGQHYLLGPRIAFTYDALCRAIAGENHE
jgi:iron complex transport system substrate-binding protein